jgi:hypothetical protein
METDNRDYVHERTQQNLIRNNQKTGPNPALIPTEERKLK